MADSCTCSILNSVAWGRIRPVCCCCCHRWLLCVLCVAPVCANATSISTSDRAVPPPGLATCNQAACLQAYFCIRIHLSKLIFMLSAGCAFEVNPHYAGGKLTRFGCMSLNHWPESGLVPHHLGSTNCTVACLAFVFCIRWPFHFSYSVCCDRRLICKCCDQVFDAVCILYLWPFLHPRSLSSPEISTSILHQFNIIGQYSIAEHVARHSKSALRSTLLGIANLSLKL